MKVGIALIAGDMMHTKTAYDLIHLVNYAAGPCGYDIHLHHEGGSWIGQQRENATKALLEEGCDYLFFCDTDMRVPVNTLQGLIEHDLPAVAANCVRRKRPVSPIARVSNGWVEEGKQAGDGETLWTYPDSTGLERVITVGFGVILVKAEVFREIGQPWFATPWQDELGRYTGEDTYFCAKLYEADIPLYIDHDLSWAVKHIGNYEYSHEDALNERMLVETGAWEHEGFTPEGKIEVVRG